MRKLKGNLFVISAPSGAGKTTLVREIIKCIPRLELSVSYTTRPPRTGEADGVDYHFISREKFRRMLDKNQFVEWAEVYGNFYGTSEKDLRKMAAAGTDIILDIDTKGAKQIRRKFPEAVLIFILPPSISVLRERLGRRKTDSPEVIEKRLKKAGQEIKQYKIYDYAILNDKLEEAVQKLEAVVVSRRASVSRIDPLWIKTEFLEVQ